MKSILDNSNNINNNNIKNNLNNHIITFKDKKGINNVNNDMFKYNDQELNSLVYKDALIIDKRKYLQYYFSLLRTKHIIIFSFYMNNNYNSKPIKISIFLFICALSIIF